jgi:hypothetical protein
MAITPPGSFAKNVYQTFFIRSALSRSLHRNIIFMKGNLLYAEQGRTQIPPKKSLVAKQGSFSKNIKKLLLDESFGHAGIGR